MESVVKRIISLFSVLLLTVTGLAITAAPASADFNQYNGQTLYYEVGESVYLNWNLCGADATDNGFDNGTLPPGLSEDNLGIVSGTVTTAGTYAMTGFWCTIPQLSGRAGYNSGGITIVVSDPPPVLTPDPSITAFNLNNANCELLVVAALPATPDAGNLVLHVSNGINFLDADLGGYALGEVIELKIPLDSVSDIANDPTVESFYESNSPSGFACGQSVTATITYTSGGALEASASSSAVTVTRASELTATPAGSIEIFSLNDAACNLKIVGALPVANQAGTLGISVTDGTEDLDLTLRDYAAGELINLTISLNDLNGSISGNSTDIVDAQVFDIGSEPFACGAILSAKIQYRYGGYPRAQTWTSPKMISGNSDVTPALTETPAGQLLVRNMNDAACTLHVVASIPLANDAGTLAVGLSSGDHFMWFTLQNHAAGDMISFDIPLRGGIDAVYSGGEVVSMFTSASGQQSIWCGDAVTPVMTYQYNGLPAGNTTLAEMPTVAPADTLNGTVQISGNRDANCSVNVMVNVTERAPEGSSLLLYVGTEYGDGSMFTLTDFTLDDPFLIKAPLLDAPDTAIPFVDGSSGQLGGYRCGSPTIAALFIETDGDLTNPASQYSNAITTSQSCNPGRYDLEGLCVPAELGFFVPFAGSNSAIACPAGKTTEFTGTVSASKCFTPKSQSVTGLKVPKGVKLKSVFALPAKTAAGVTATVVASGACTAAPIAKGTKVNGKKVAVASVKVTASATAGICTLRFTSNRIGKYAPLTKVVNIKVSRTGK